MSAVTYFFARRAPMAYLIFGTLVISLLGWVDEKISIFGLRLSMGLYAFKLLIVIE